MTARAVIAGTAWRVARPFDGRLEVVIRGTVVSALAEAGLAIGDIDSFVTVASDTLDGMSVPGRAEIAGAYSRRLLNVPSSAGHGLAAAAVQIEAGEAENLLLVGWGAATKYVDHDGRANQADPFYARPVGATPRVVAALQAQEIMDVSGAGAPVFQAYSDEMFSRAWPGHTAEAHPWARSRFCDGVVALVIRRGDAGSGIAIRDFGSVSRPYMPEDDRLDTAAWAAEALSEMKLADQPACGVIEVCAPTPVAEARAIDGIAARFRADGTKVNLSGGGAVAHFGAATGLRQIAEASRLLSQKASAGPSGALALDLSGPLGQHATAVLLQRGESR